jgi:rSAM/selenodomain-associated transferase 1
MMELEMIGLPTICLMLKAPRPAQVKTRLACQIGIDEACDVYRRLVRHQLAQIPAGWPVEIHYAPEEARDEMRAWLGARYVYIHQPEGDFGHRLKEAMNGAFARGAQGVLLLGGDCPYVTAELLHEAAEKLREHDVVLGPAEDGGYYLLATKSARPSLFQQIDWSTERVFGQTTERVGEAQLTLACLATFSDVDDLESWKKAQSDVASLGHAPR